MKTLFFILLSCSLQALSIVFIHVGRSPLPSHLAVSIAQARLFNPNCSIYLIAHASVLRDRPYEEQDVIRVSCESLTPTPAHQNFLNCRSHLDSANGFWIWTSERFFYLDELIRTHGLFDVFHLENDMMIYVDLEKMLPIFQKRYKGMIAATFERDDRCVPGFLYISNPAPMEILANSFPNRIEEGTTDMHTLAQFKHAHQGILIDFLPVMIPEYIEKGDFQIPISDPTSYMRYFDEFQSVFDAAAFGVYLGGWDEKFHGEQPSGVVSGFCFFNSSHFVVDWQLDEQGRKVPFLVYNGTRTKINNLHITNKGKISLFSSTQVEL